jgi:aryl-alcohol dehydrogenase-like predicted oxidoreductase
LKSVSQYLYRTSEQEGTFMIKRSLGQSGPRVPALGLGCMGMSDFYGPADEAESIATIRAALDAGVTLLDTGDYYGMGHNELLIREALRGRAREQVVISVKFGLMRAPDGNVIGNDLRPPAVKNFLAYTLRRLGTDYVDVYRPGRVFPDLPIEDTVGAIAELIEAGYVRHVGLSEVGAETVRRAQAAHPVSDLQIEYSLVSRGIEDDILPVCRELGIGITAYGVLSRGLISGHWSRQREETLTPHDFRASAPRFTGENLERNLVLVETLRGLADEKGATVAQLAIAWVLSRGDDIVPIVGARRRVRLTEALGAVDLELTADDLARIEAAVPVGAAAGERYHSQQMAVLDSERR